MMSWVIVIIGITSMALLGYEGWRRQAGFILGILNQFIWIGYAVITTQHGFILRALMYGGVCAVNLWRLRRRRP